MTKMILHFVEDNMILEGDFTMKALDILSAFTMQVIGY